jgi:transcription elongation factor Elf1
MIGRLECFNCGTKTSKKKSFTVEMNTEEGKKSLILCEECGKNFDVMVKEYEELFDERPNSV